MALDAIARERECLEPLFRDGLSAALAVAETTLVDLLQSRHHFFQESPVAIAQLEEELAIVRRGRLIAEVLDGVVFRPLAVQHVLADFFDELAVLLFQLLAKVAQALLFHRCLLRHTVQPATLKGAGYHDARVKSNIPVARRRNACRPSRSVMSDCCPTPSAGFAGEICLGEVRKGGEAPFRVQPSTESSGASPHSRSSA